MTKGRGGAVAMVLVLCLMVLQQYQVAQAAEYIVGDDDGWDYNTVDWPKGKNFRAGDILVFKYEPNLHNVVVVDKDSYDRCSTPEGAKVYTSGNDRIKLVKGQNSFICNFPIHCEQDMKITLNAA